jgi:maltose alpha-D-glucosyltransferase/alpha-amylase
VVQASRNDPDGPFGDFYVWSDTDELYQDARIIFVDTETSNWTWDPVRGQYFWHRFYGHQPDLNFDNPAVHDAMFEALSFWLDMGIDGFRLDAVPYLYEREGTNGENLPETHEFLRKVRPGSTPTTRGACCWPRRTSGRPTSSTTSATSRPAATSATCASTSR